MLVGTAALLAFAPPGSAHESDQYSLPVGRDFADLGPYFSNIVEAALRAAVTQTNAQIDAALTSESPQAASALQSSDHIASMLWAELFRAFPTNELLDGSLLSADVRDGYPGLVTLHWPVPSIYDDPLLLLDLSKFVRTFFRAGTVSVGGTVIGTDKVIHFINVGRIYHAKYEQLLAQGQSADQAVGAAISATSANPFYSEDGFLGIFTTGIHSNADLAADLAGFKFYRNLTETVRLGDREWPAMLVRDGPFWRVQMRAGSQRFTAFVTPHWNEVLNPNRYLDYVAAGLREPVHQRCADVLDLYRDRYGRKRGRAQFEAIENEFATLFGEPYDHQRNEAGRVAVAALCFAPDAEAPSANPPPATDAMGRTSLWWAAHDGHTDTIDRLLADKSDPAAADLDGDTPLHAAARAGQLDAAKRLLRQGGPVNAAGLYGVTPLMLAASRGDLPLAQTLLEAGAMPNLEGPFGRTALHQAIAAGQDEMAELLLRRGADPLRADDMGNSAVHLAARRGDERLLAVFAAAEALAAAPNARGATPADAAEQAGHTKLADWLRADAALRALAAVDAQPIGLPADLAAQRGSLEADTAAGRHAR